MEISNLFKRKKNGNKEGDKDTVEVKISGPLTVKDPNNSPFRRTIPLLLGLGAYFIIVPMLFGGMQGKKLIYYNSAKPRSLVANLLSPQQVPKVAHIKINGSIAGGHYSDSINSLIGKAMYDNVKAFVFEVSSPGGTILPTKEISDKINEIERGLDGKKGTEDDILTIALIRDVGASGAYWVASAADVIVADEMSIVGSIGVYGSFFTIEELMKKVGVKHELIKAGERKDIGNMYRDPNPEEREILQKHISEAYEFFVNAVAENRNMDYEEVKKLATGEFWYGKEALENGLIDKLGGKNEVINWLKGKLGEKIIVETYYTPPTFMDQFGLFGKSVGQGIGEAVMK